MRGGEVLGPRNMETLSEGPSNSLQPDVSCTVYTTCCTKGNTLGSPAAGPATLVTPIMSSIQTGPVSRVPEFRLPVLTLEVARAKAAMELLKKLRPLFWFSSSLQVIEGTESCEPRDRRSNLFDRSDSYSRSRAFAQPLPRAWLLLGTVWARPQDADFAGLEHH